MNNLLRSHPALRGTFLSLVLAASFVMGSSQVHAASISTQLDLGATGQQVTDLQTYLATNTSIYPERLVTGYFGSLTQAAVERFQVAQGIVSSGSPSTTGYGRVGPSTLTRLNALMGGVVVNNAWNTVPVLNAPSLNYTNTSATFAFTTNEPTQGQVYWDTSPIRADEATGPGQTPYVSGTLALDAGGYQTGHTVTISNLQPNTTYYYLIRVMDSQGGITITWPSANFHTNN